MKLAFVHIPKTAGGSIKTWFRNHCNETFVTQRHNLLKEFNYDYDISFTVTRNTYKRLISLYNHSKIITPQKIFKRELKQTKPEEVIHLKEIKKHQDRGLLDYLRYLIDIDDNATKSLLQWTDDVDIVLEQENLKTQFKQIQTLANCFVPLPTDIHKMKYNYEDFCTNEYISFIEKNFEKEIELFNYTPY